MAMNAPPTYAEYERRRLGNSASRWAGIAYMFRRSFGASSFAGFWRHWNPLFSYFLYYRCYRPLARFLPRSLAVMLTFVASGAVHDIFASLAVADVFVLFAPAFAVFGLLVIVEEWLGVDLLWAPSWLRATIHTAVIVGTIAAGAMIRSRWFDDLAGGQVFHTVMHI